MFDLNLSGMEILVLVGFVSIVFEIFLLSGIGVLFLGLGSFSAAGLLCLEPALLPYIYFFLGVFSIVWAMLLSELY